MILWPKQWGSPWNRTAGMCHDVLADDIPWCERVGPTQPPEGSSSFEVAMHGAGVLVLAADSRVIWPTLHQTFGDLLNATRWMPWDDSASPPMLSLSYTSARVPNVFCAQPTFDALGCGAHDVLLLFRSSPELLKFACSISLHDACGRNLCRRERRAQVLSQFRSGANPRSTLRSRTRRTCPGRHELERAAALCDLQGGTEEGAGRCTTTGAAGLEEAMLAFQAACRVPPAPATAPATTSGPAAGPVRSNTSFEESPTCWGRNRGALHNELQFMAPSTHEIGRLLAMALIGVGVIGVGGILVASHPGSSSSSSSGSGNSSSSGGGGGSGGSSSSSGSSGSGSGSGSGGGGGVGSRLANASVMRRCRARRLAVALYERFLLTPPSAAQRSSSHSPSSHSSAWSRPQSPRLEVWGFEMKPSHASAHHGALPTGMGLRDETVAHARSAAAVQYACVLLASSLVRWRRLPQNLGLCRRGEGAS
jgi:hypothetical protein